MRNRTTSTYTIDVQTTEPNAVCDALRAAAPADLVLTASGVDAARAFVRFRAADDAEAIRLATQFRPPVGATLHTGYGVNTRIVAVQD
jgi:hypothetical protein